MYSILNNIPTNEIFYIVSIQILFCVQLASEKMAEAKKERAREIQAESAKFTSITANERAMELAKKREIIQQLHVCISLQMMAYILLINIHWNCKIRLLCSTPEPRGRVHTHHEKI